MEGESMDKAQEEAVIKAFCYKNKRKRILYELAHDEKRRDFLWDLSGYRHFIPEYMIEIKKPYTHASEVLELLQSYRAPDTCYVISLGRHDGEYMTLKDAVEYTFCGYGDNTLISCIPGKLAYWVGELCCGPPPKCILYRK